MTLGYHVVRRIRIYNLHAVLLKIVFPSNPTVYCDKILLYPLVLLILELGRYPVVSFL